MSDKIVVTSAGGTVGTEVVKQLADLGAPVVAVTHRGGNAAKKSKLPAGVPTVEANYSHPASLSEALRGATKLMLISPYAANQVDLARNIVEAAREQGVGHVVVLSGYNVEDDPRVAIGQKLYEQEQLVRQSGIPFTFLRACSFMQNFIHYYPPQPDGNFYMPIGDQKMNFVDARDIARVAVLALTQPGHQNQVYRLATVSHTIAEVAQALSRATGRPYQYVDVPPSAVREGMEQYGVPAWMIGENLELYAAAKAGFYTKTAPDFQALTGQPPTDLVTFFADHRAAFGA